MAFSRGPKITKEGLVLMIDAANVKSFRGEPTVNKISGDFDTTFDSLSEGSVAGFNNQLGSGNYLGVSSDFAYSGSKSLRINRGTGGTGRVYRTFSVALGEYSTVSAWVYSNVAGPFIALEYFGGDYNWGVAYTNNTHTGSGWELIWCKTSGGATSSSTGYYFLHPSANNVDTYWDNIQVENKQYNTPYVNGTRGTTVAAGGGLKDLSGVGNHGELVNGLKFASNNQGSILFDGVDDVLVLGPSTQFLYPQHSYEAWIKTSGLGGNTQSGIFGISYGLTINLVAGGSLNYGIYSNESSSYAISDTSVGVNLFDGKWHHILCTRGDSTYGIYIDGVLNRSGGAGSWTGTNIWASMNAQIGNNPNNVNLRYNGEMTSIKFYNKFLTSDEVLQNYNATKGRFE